MTLRSLFWPFGTVTHLNGQFATPKERQTAFAMTAAGFIPLGKGATVVKTVAENAAEHGTVDAGLTVAEKTVENVVNEEVKIVTANGIKVTGFTEHGVTRAIERGVKPDAILQALKTPLKIGKVTVDEMGRVSQRFIGKSAEVAINPQTGRIISVNPTSTAKAARLLRQISTP